MTDETKRGSSPLLYEGRRFIRGDRDSKPKMQHVFRVMEGDDAGTQMWWPKAKSYHFMGAKIGTVYDMPGGLPDVWSKVEIGEHDETETLEMQAMDRDAVIRGNESAQDPSEALSAAIDAIVCARSALVPSRRRIFDLWLMGELVTRRPKT